MDRPCDLSVIADSKKKNAAIPAFLSPQATLKHWFTTALDIRSVPKKVCVCVLYFWTESCGKIDW